MPGDYGGGVIPVPIPNTEVKPSYADDTAPLRGGKVGRRQAFFMASMGLGLAIRKTYIKSKNAVVNIVLVLLLCNDV